MRRPTRGSWGALVPVLEDPDPCAVHPGCGVGAVGRRKNQRPAAQDARAGGEEELELLVLDPAAL